MKDRSEVFFAFSEPFERIKEPLLLLGTNNYFFKIIHNTYPCDPDSNNSFVYPASLI